MEWSPAEVPAAAATLRDAGYREALAHLLARRGVADPRTAAEFLRPSLDQLHDPHRLAGLDAAVERLLRARREGRPVALVGDYDVDGVSGTAILTAVFQACGLEVHPIVPHRMHDGYGFQPSHVEKAVALGCTAVVTIDCGTSSLAAAESALAAGVDVVVTDHHLPGTPLPAAVILVNPRQADCEYPFVDLCGAGLAFKLGLAFADACERTIDPRVLLRIACLGTIADLVPLRGENRVIAALGLEELPKTRSPGLQALFRAAGVRPPFTTADVGFRIGPRLNAAGRLDSAEAALELLLSRDPRRAGDLAFTLDRLNRERQQEEAKVVTEAREVFVQRDPLPPILVAWSEHWHRGVVGIAAGRLARELNRPTLLLAVAGDAATGSGRSIPGIHLHDFLAAWRERLLRFGGHAQAIGLSAGLDRLEGLRREWEAEAEVWAARVAVRRYEYELDLAAAAVGDELYAELQRLEPHGEGNPRPLIRIRGPLRLARSPRSFGHGHLSGEAVADDGGRIRLLGWRWQERSADLLGDFEVLGQLEYDTYRNGPVVRLVDVRPPVAVA